MSRSLRSLRVFAALLAAVGLLARPARAVVVCPMETPVVAELASGDEHAHHGEHSEASAGDGTRSGEAPAHEICPDLAHCAVAAPAAANDLSNGGALVRAQRVVAVQDRPTSAITSLEPPPPKRS